MFGRRTRATAAAAVTAAVVALSALSGCSATTGVAAAPADPAAPGAAHVAVVGDSIEAGLGLDASESWPALLAAERGWALDNLSESGAGFVATGSSGEDFGAQVDRAIGAHAGIVFIGASDNDLGHPASTVAAAMTEQLHRLRTALPQARIVGFNALTGQAGDADLASGDAALEQAVAAVGGTWMPLGQPYRDRAGLVQDDGEHPTLEGQQAIASTVDAWLDSAAGRASLA